MIDQLEQFSELILNRIEQKLAPRFEAINQRFDTMDESIRDLRVRVVRLEEKVEDAIEVMSGYGRAIDSDSIQLLDHEKRIKRLEKKQKFA